MNTVLKAWRTSDKKRKYWKSGLNTNCVKIKIKLIVTLLQSVQQVALQTKLLWVENQPNEKVKSRIIVFLWWRNFTKAYYHRRSEILVILNSNKCLLKFVRTHIISLIICPELRPKLKNLNCVAESPKTSYLQSSADSNLETLCTHSHVEPTMFEPRLKFETRIFY